MQSYLVIPVFIRPLLVMVVEDGGQNRVHLGEPLALVFEGSWAGRQGGGRGEGGGEPGVCLGWGLAFHFPWMGAGPPPCSVLEDAHSLAGRFPACLPQMDHTPHFHKHAFSLSLTEDSDDNRSNQPQIQTGCGRR